MCPETTDLETFLEMELEEKKIEDNEIDGSGPYLGAIRLPTQPFL
jgi:hypothetical protein